MEELDTEYIKNFEKLELNYNKFYNTEVNTIKLFFIYINENNEIYTIRQETEIVKNACVTKERLLYLIKNNQYPQHKLVSLLQFNIYLDHTDINNFILNKIKDSYLFSLKIVDNIKFKDTIPLFMDLNSLLFIYKINTNTQLNTTKKIMITTDKLKPKSKTRRKYITTNNQILKTR